MDMSLLPVDCIITLEQQSVYNCLFLRFLIFFSDFFSFRQAREVQSGSHGLQQQPVLQGQPLPLQVELTNNAET